MPAQISVITGDLVNSRQLDTTHYITELHALLTQLQQAKLIQTFEVFRGDAFQAVAEPQSGLLLAVYIRIALKAMDTRHWDARIAVGLGAGGKKRRLWQRFCEFGPGAGWPDEKLPVSSEK